MTRQQLRDAILADIAAHWQAIGIGLLLALAAVAIGGYLLGRRSATDHAYGRGYADGRRDASWGGGEEHDDRRARIARHAGDWTDGLPMDLDRELDRAWQEMRKEAGER